MRSGARSEGGAGRVSVKREQGWCGWTGLERMCDHQAAEGAVAVHGGDVQGVDLPTGGARQGTGSRRGARWRCILRREGSRCREEATASLLEWIRSKFVSDVRAKPEGHGTWSGSPSRM